MPELDLHARRSDPNSSHRRVQLLGRDGSVRHTMLRIAADLERGRVVATTPVGVVIVSNAPWSDGDVWAGVEHALGRREQRNVIARHRGIMERDGLVERLGEMTTIDGHDRVLHFRLTEHARELLGLPPRPPAQPIQETLL